MRTVLEAGAPVKTVEDYLKTEFGPPWFELIEGQLVQEPSPTSDHQSVVNELIFALNLYFRAKSDGRVFPAPLDVFLGTDSVLQPDIAVILKDRHGLISKRGIEGAPDLVIEVLSPSNRNQDKGPKRRIYQRHGVRALWLIEPQQRTIECENYEAGEASLKKRIWREGEVLQEPILPGFSIAVAEIFQHCIGE